MALATILAAGMALTVVTSPAQEGQGKKSEQKKKPEAASLTGCVDQQEGQYVLVNDRDLTFIAGLEAEGFPTEGFAKHVGQKVTVKGTSNPGGTRPVFKVRSIETVSDTCAPETAPQGKKEVGV